MLDTLKRVVLRLTPPIVADIYRRLRGSGIQFHGAYSSWNEAQQRAEGYDAEAVLQRVRQTTIAVVKGEAVCERDGVLFHQAQYPLAVIAVLLRAATENGNRLTVLDFGGALGSTYYQCRDFLQQLKPLRWCIVEQPGFVACGRQQFQNEIIHFYSNVPECLAQERPQVVLLSGVLQYLADPVQVLDELSRGGAKYIVIDRTPVAVNGEQAIIVQTIPETIIRSSYPAWLFNEQVLKRPLRERYEEIAAFDTVDPDLGSGRLRARFKGFIFRKRDEHLEGDQ